MLRVDTALRFALTTFLSAVLLTPVVQAQENETISADRPGFRTSATTLSTGTFQAELGYELGSAEHAFIDENLWTHNIGLLLLRYGVTDAVEVRANVGSFGLREQFTGVSIPSLTPDTEYESGYNGAAVEVKAQAVETSSATVGFYSSTTVPLESGPFDSPDDRARQTVLALVDGAVAQNVTLSVNVGPSFYWSSGEQNDRFFSALFIPTLSFSINDETSGYLGYAGTYTEALNQNFVETGFTYLLNDDTQIDINGGVQVDDYQNAYFLGLGLARRF